MLLRKNRSLICCVCALSLLVSADLQATATKVCKLVPDYAASTISFVGQGKLKLIGSVFSVEGVWKTWKADVQMTCGKPSSATGTIEVNVDSLDTGISRRDRHLKGKDFLDAKSYPKAIFKLVEVVAGAAKNTWRIKGNLTLHGVTKAFEALATLVSETRDGKKYLILEGEGLLNRRDYGIAYDSGAFLPDVLDEVKLRFKLLSSSTQ